MKVTLFESHATGMVTAPPSKSMAHRALICGAFSGHSVIRSLAFSKDIEATVGCLQSLGVNLQQAGDTVTLGGFSFENIPDNATLFCNESGSTLRFLLPLCMAAGKPVTLYGSTRLFERPLDIYEQIAAEQHIQFIKESDRVTVCGRLQSGNYTVPGNVSSQFITGLLFALSLLEGESTLTVTDAFESASYVDLTIWAMADFGVTVKREGNVFTVGGGHYQNRAYTVEGDCSNAAFLEALNLLGGDVTVTGLLPDTLQGDRVYRDLFDRIANGNATIDLSDCPDLAPVCFAVAAAKGGARFIGTARLRIKESDRAAAMAQELAAFGIGVAVEDNAVTVHGGTLCRPNRALCGHNDHRIVMALSLLCSVTGGTILGAQAVEKSYPDFFDVLKSLQIGLVTDDSD